MHGGLALELVRGARALSCQQRWIACVCACVRHTREAILITVLAVNEFEAIMRYIRAINGDDSEEMRKKRFISLKHFNVRLIHSLP